MAEEQYFDEFNTAPPGHSLTEDNSKWPWGRPPEMVDPDQAMDSLVDKLMDPRKKQEMFKLLMVGVSVEVIVEGMLFQAFRDGRFTPDVGLLEYIRENLNAAIREGNRPKEPSFMDMDRGGEE